MHSVFATLGFVSLWSVEAHPGYVGSLPNGFQVKGPRNPMAIGHVNPHGRGERNQFGIDFHNNNYKWTKVLCRMDSDGDGMTNGMELGDPDCKWKKGKGPPSRTTDITHPGIPDVNTGSSSQSVQE